MGLRKFGKAKEAGKSKAKSQGRERGSILKGCYSRMAQERYAGEGAASLEP